MKTKVEQKGQGVQVFSMSENQCVWMKAGVVNFKICENAFDCTSCAFDKGMSKKLSQKPTALVSWKEVMQNPNLHKQCRHMLTGRVIFKLCSHNFECKDCAYDQQLCDYDQFLCEEDLSAHAAAQVNKVAGFMVADGYYYHMPTSRSHQAVAAEHAADPTPLVHAAAEGLQKSSRTGSPRGMGGGSSSARAGTRSCAGRGPVRRHLESRPTSRAIPGRCKSEGGVLAARGERGVRIPAKARPGFPGRILSLSQGFARAFTDARAATDWLVGLCAC